MANGIEIYNDNSFIQIDGASRSYEIIEEGTTTAYSEDIAPIFANWNLYVRTGREQWIVKPVSESGLHTIGIATGSFTDQRWLPIVNGTNKSISVYYAIIRYKTDYYTPATSGYGVEVFDSSGGLVWTSNVRQLLVKAVGIVSADASTKELLKSGISGVYGEIRPILVKQSGSNRYIQGVEFDYSSGTLKSDNVLYSGSAWPTSFTSNTNKIAVICGVMGV